MQDEIKLWGYTFHHQPSTYIPVARLPGERTWRKICYPSEDDHRAYTQELLYLCIRFSNQPKKINTSNVISSEVWLAQVVVSHLFQKIEIGERPPGVYLDYIVEGNCSQYGSKLLFLQCDNTGN